MRVKTVLALALALSALSMLFSGAVGAAAVPADGVLDFVVLRDVDEIGTHTMKFTRDGDRLDVDIATDI